MDRSLWLMLGVILIASLSFAGKKEDEGKALLDRAKQLSDIRAEGAPAFRLKASFKVIREDSTITEGTYTETWVSPGQWRTETILGNFRGTEVANGKKLWILNSTSSAPLGMGEVGFRMAGLKFSSDFWKPAKIEDRDIQIAVRCVYTKLDPTVGKSALCFDKSTGTVAAKVVPLDVQGRRVDNRCEYRDYQNFGEKMFPGVIRCFEGPRPTFEETLLELSAEPSRDPELFAPLVGGTESVNCQGVPKPPTAVYTPEPEYPSGRKNPKNPVVLSLIVDAGGKTHDLRVVRSADAAFDNAAMEAVRRWRFKPATCEGETIATTINVDITFRVP
jgi:TonB family protein